MWTETPVEELPAGGAVRAIKRAAERHQPAQFNAAYGRSKETETHDLISTIERYLLQDSDQKAPAALLIASTTFSGIDRNGQ